MMGRFDSSTPLGPLRGCATIMYRPRGAAEALLLALQVGGAAAQACTFAAGSCTVTCGSHSYDLSQMTPPASGYFTATATTPPMPAWFYFSACGALDTSQISCPSPDRRRQLQFGPSGGNVMAIQYWGETPCTAGTPCTLQDSCATLGTPPPSCMGNGTAGVICSFQGGSGARSVDLDFVCSVSATPPPRSAPAPHDRSTPLLVVCPAAKSGGPHRLPDGRHQLRHQHPGAGGLPRRRWARRLGRALVGLALPHPAVGRDRGVRGRRAGVQHQGQGDGAWRRRHHAP